MSISTAYDARKTGYDGLPKNLRALATGDDRWVKDAESGEGFFHDQTITDAAGEIEHLRAIVSEIRTMARADHNMPYLEIINWPHKPA